MIGVLIGVAAFTACCHAEDNTTNIISGTTNNIAGNYIVGATGTNNYLEINNSGRLGDTTGIIGSNSFASFNTALVTGTGSVWSNSASLYIGNYGAGNRLTVSDGALVFNDNWGYIGVNTSSSNNVVLVTDTGSVWSNSWDLYIGFDGAGNRLTVSNGGYVQSAGCRIGTNPNSSNNAVLVTGTGSVWSNSASLYIGYLGLSNQLTVSNGALVFNDNWGWIGWNTTSSNNVVLVTGTGSVWSNSTVLCIGYSGAGNQLTVSDGALVRNSFGYIGFNISSRNNAVLVTGTNTVWRNPSPLYIGHYGAGNQLTVSNGALVRNSTGYIGNETSSSNNVVLVTGTGSVWSNSSDLYIGTSGAGNQLTVSNGARVHNSQDAYIGYLSDSSNNAVLVTGSGSVWKSGDNNWNVLYVGYYGAGNQLTVSNGARVFDYEGWIGRQTNSGNNAVLVTGTGSLWSNSEMQVGVSGAGNQLTVSDGALVQNAGGFVGVNDSSSNNVVLVTGPGSRLEHSSALSIGYRGAGNQLTVSNGACLFNDWCTIGYNTSSSNNVVLVTGTGSVWSNSSSLDIGGSGAGNRLTVSDGALVRNSTGYIGWDTSSGNNAVLVTGTGSVWSNSSSLYVGYYGSSNQLHIVEGATAFASTAYIGFYAGAVGNSIWLSNGTLVVSSLSISNGNAVAGWGTITGTVANWGTLTADGGTLSVSGSVTNYGTLRALNGGVAEFFDTVLDLGNADFSGGSAIFHALYLSSGNPTNAWVDAGSGLWREDEHWSLGIAPMNMQSYLVITNANTKTVTVDALTPVLAPGSLTNWSTTVSAPAGSTNTLSVETMGWTMANVSIGSGGRLSISNATVTVGIFGLGALGVDGELAINTGTLDASAVAVTLGGNGTATASFTNGVLVSKDCWIEGTTTGGVVIASGNGFWQQQGDLWIGTNTSGNSLLIAGGLQVANATGYIGYNTSSSNNVVLVTGPGSVWSNSGSLSIGYYGAGNQLTVSNGALVQNTGGNIGRYASSDNNVVLVAGSDSVWSNSGNLNIGNIGVGNQLTVSNGALVFNNYGYIGLDASSSNNAVLVTGTGSVWSNSAGLRIGNSGSGNRLTVSNGALVFNGGGLIGDDASSSNNAVLVTGSNSVWGCRGDLYVGNSGPGNVLTVSNSARVFNDGGFIGYNTNSSNNAVLVTGAGSVWSNSSGLFIGRYGAGNHLTVSNGAFVQNSNGYIGRYASSDNNAVLVAGSGSVWSNSLSLYVGYSGSSNQLRIVEGATVIATNVWIGFSASSSNNVVAIFSGNLIVANSDGSGVLGIRRGSLTLSNGTVFADMLVVTNGAKSVLTFQSGNLSVSSSIINNGQQFVVGTGAGTATLQLRGGTHSFANGLLLTTNATLTGSGQINSSVTNDGFVTPGVLSVSNNFNAGAYGGSLRIRITGATVSDQLNVGNTANLGGDLTILLDGYTPRSGETFSPVTASSVGGFFATTNLPPTWPGLSWELEYLPTVVRLSVVGRAVLANYDLYASYHNLGANSDLNDPNNNGIPNLMEYALGRDPTSAVYRAATTHGRSNGWFQINFTRNTDATNLAYRVEAANILANGGDWSCILSNINASGWLGPASCVESVASNGIAEVTVTDIATAATNRFLRLRVTRP